MGGGGRSENLPNCVKSLVNCSNLFVKKLDSSTILEIQPVWRATYRSDCQREVGSCQGCLEWGCQVQSGLLEHWWISGWYSLPGVNFIPKFCQKLAFQMPKRSILNGQNPSYLKQKHFDHCKCQSNDILNAKIMTF